MKNLIIILLFVCASAMGQYTVVHNGSPVGGGGYVTAQIQDLPWEVLPDDPDPDPDPDDNDTIDLIIVGNSIANAAYDSLLQEYPGVFTVTDIAVPGDGIEDQEDAWDAFVISDPDVVAAADWVCIAPVGVNDIAGGASASTMENRYNSLITAIHSDIPATCQILMYTMTPILGNPYVTTAEAAVLKSTNENVIEPGLTNVDVTSTKHWDDLKMASYDTMHVWYNINRDYTHPNWLGERIMRENLLEDIDYEVPWEDSVDFDQLYFVDFQDWPVTNTITASAPVGIHDDTVAKYFPNFRAVESDATELGHGDPDYASNADIVEFGGVKVVQSWYLINRCCTGALSDDGIVDDPTTDPAYIPGGTGFQFAAWITDPKTHVRRVIWHQWIYFPKATDKFGEFENSDGFKMPSVQINRDGVGDGTSSYMVLNYSAGTETDPAYYNGAHWTDWSYTIVRANTKTIEPDTWFTPGWHLVSKYQDAGTVQGTNGVNHMYIDGKLIDDGAGGGVLNSIPYLTTGDPAGFSHIEWRGFMGGDNDAYMSPKTQTLYFGPFGVETQDGYDTTPTAGQDIYIPYYMKELGLSWD